MIYYYVHPESDCTFTDTRPIEDLPNFDPCLEEVPYHIYRIWAIRFGNDVAPPPPTYFTHLLE